MATQMDALQSFSFLADSVPQWLTKLDELVSKCDIQYERFTRISQHGEVKLTRKKHDSTESLRPGKDIETTALSAMNVDGPSMPTKAVAALPSEPEKSSNLEPFASRDLHRKRRAGSDLSGAPSNHCRYRTKSMVVVYYDSEIQSLFEALVKNIATARNNLRKGKNAATIKTRMVAMGMASSASQDRSSDRMEGLLLDPKLMMAKARLGRQPRGNATKYFEDADKDLEDAQNLCEGGAHQFLRDGDCQAEIEGTRKRFASCRTIATQEVEKLKKEEEARRAHEMDVEDVEDEKTLVGGTTPPSDTMEEKSIEVSIDHKFGPPPLKQVTFAGAGAIEIDDGSDEESIQIDMSAIRRTVRSARV
ncbi:uncharacterized protein KY384_007596 [Bacidia gigantensis]|uniref:uncharacterized protein n=1 Tax=Bacidia gigantensis TaxID=2732470 RepID=UPI001D043E19|nr:uncharacterized protein KY384_007596 [Bacidia gigantensis]KAG8527444.1 hypothetical protein KY384_007596 [Bacidia gigantensis]